MKSMLGSKSFLTMIGLGVVLSAAVFAISLFSLGLALTVAVLGLTAVAAGIYWRVSQVLAKGLKLQRELMTTTESQLGRIESLRASFANNEASAKAVRAEMAGLSKSQERQRRTIVSLIARLDAE